MTLDEYQQILPNAQAEGLTWLTPNTHVAWRVQSLRTKEPDTFAWIEKMQPGENFFDVGANIGQYSMLAAKRGLLVHAFEPEAQNFALMVRNFAINKLESAYAWPVALSDSNGMAQLHLSTVMAGGSCHAFGESRDFRGQIKEFPARQGAVGFKMDYAADMVGAWPHHIKIDVDGFEHRVIQGAEKCLQHAKSVLIELNRNYPEHVQLLDYMTNGLGFEYDAATAEEARRKEGPFTNVGNVIFYRS
jgi:FkbM family methyltransferase